MKFLLPLTFLVILATGCGTGTPVPEQPAEQSTAPTGKAGATPKEGPKQKPGHKTLVVVTPAAAAQLRKLQKERGANYLRVSVAATDLKYHLDLDSQMNAKDDLLCESEGIQIVVDRTSSQLVPHGTIVDWIDAGGQVGFKVSGPDFDDTPPDTTVTLAKARRAFKTKLTRQDKAGAPVPQPPAKLFRTVAYDSPVGKLAAYLTPDPRDGKQHPAIIWITGGDSNSIGDDLWKESPPSNDQTASAFRKAGIVMMFPSLRGGNENPGVKEGFFGEVDDVAAAAEFLAKQPFVDPQRIYLGGHSTGGTMVLLTAECSDRFRAVFSFGPARDVVGYGPRYVPFVLSDLKELELRAPGRWLHSIRVPVFVFEGTGGNLDSLQALARVSKNPKVQFLEIKGANHFSTLAPTTRRIADKILHDSGPTCNLAFTEEEVSKPFAN